MTIEPKSVIRVYGRLVFVSSRIARVAVKGVVSATEVEPNYDETEMWTRCRKKCKYGINRPQKDEIVCKVGLMADLGL